MKNFIALLFALFAMSRLYGQSQPQVPNEGVTIANPVPASPDAAALGKYGSIPVSAYTGVPNISIPLYTIKSGDLSLPISLSYHGSGNKVEEMASSVGLGWSLNAGGAITRTIRGKPDEEYNGYLTQSSASQINSLLTSFQANPSNLNSTQQAQLDFLLNATADGTMDSEPDIYNYNFAGYSGQFVMDGSGNVTVMPLQNIKFTFNVFSSQTTYIQSFTAQTPDGCTYYFGGTSTDPTKNAIEFTGASGSSARHAISWFLYKIVSPSHHEIDLTYNLESYDVVTAGLQTFVFRNYVGNFDQQAAGAPLNNQSQGTTNVFNNVKLSTITFENGNLQVYSNQVRQDVTSAHAIDTIAITSGNFSKLYKFYYLNNFPSSHIRLRLDSLVGQLSPNSLPTNNQEEKYSFSYATDPKNTSLFSQDYWGYYNAQGNSYQSLGILVPASTTNLNGTNYTLPGANRAPDESSMLGGVLTRITYPTGGYTSFAFEANQEYNYDVGGTSLIKWPKISVIVARSNDSSSPYYNYDSRNGNPNDWMNVYAPGQSSAPITISVAGVGGPGAPLGDQMTALIYKFNSPTDSTLYANLANTADSTIYLPTGTYKMVLGGKYWQAYNPTSNPNGYKYTFSALCSSYTPAELAAMVNNYIAGGLRIRQISDYDGISPKPVNQRTYTYNQPGTNISSGFMAFQPVFQYELGVEGWAMQGTAVIPWVDGYLMRSSVSNYPLGTTQGEVVGYSHVEEMLGVNGVNGMNEYFYTTALQFPDLQPLINISPTILTTLPSIASIGGNSFPFGSPQNYDWHRGLLLKETTWKNAGSGNFVKVKEKANYYGQINFNINNYGIKAGFNPKPATYGQATSYYTNPAPYEFGRIMESTYSINTDHVYLASDTTRIYDQNNPTAFVQTYSTYQIDPSTYQLTQVQSTNSKNELITQKITYPNNYNAFGSTGVAGLLNAGITSYPIEEVTQRSNLDGTNSRTVKAVYSTYKLNAPYRDSVYEMRSIAGVSSFVMSNTGPSIDSHYKPVAKFDKYDTYGNILQEHKVGDANHTYIWGYANPNPPYNNSYPVAAAINADSTSIAYTNFEQLRSSATNWGNWVFNYSGVTTDATAPMGSQCYNVSSSNTLSKSGLTTATKYVVSFWAKSGAAITVTGGTVTNVATGIAKSGWLYHEYSATGTTTVTIGGTGEIDEVRLYPVNAEMTTYTYLPLVGISSKCDTKNDITYYSYDGQGRLLQVLDQNRNIVKDYQYNYMTQGAVWTNIGLPQCQKDGNNNNTGYLLQQQQDTNPYSQTYNVAQWVTAGQNTTQCPLPLPPIYVKMTLQSTTVSGDTYNTYIVRSYSDAACTQPYAVPANLSVKYTIATTNHSTNNTTNCTQYQMITAGTNSAITTAIDVTTCTLCGGSDALIVGKGVPLNNGAQPLVTGGGSGCTSTVTLSTGTGYTPEY